MANNNLAIFNMNQDIAQGADFKKYKKNYETSSGNDHSLLANTSSQQWTSINEAFTCDASTRKKTELSGENFTDNNNQQFNALLSDYANEQNIHNSGVIQKNLSNSNDANYKERMAGKLEGFTPFFDFKLLKKSGQVEGFASVRDTISGKIETSDLRMTSMYYHYLVYFLISITLLAFTFNTIFNPEADVMNAIFVVAALLMVYFFTRNVV
jgi:hypothetical protein